jgi:hypothetical protein
LLSYIAARRTSGSGGIRGGGDSFDHHALQRALAQPSREQTHQELLLFRGRATEELPEQCGTFRVRSRTANRRQFVEQGIDVK